MYYRIPLFLALLLSMRQLQMPLEGLSFVNTMAKFGIIYSTDPLLQSMTNNNNNNNNKSLYRAYTNCPKRLTIHKFDKI